MMRKGKDFYHNQYEKAMEMYNSGKSVKDISDVLGISYSSIYSWIRGKAPKKGSLNDFVDFLRKNGPSPVIVMKEMFPSHDNLYQNAVQRGFGVNRYKTSQKKPFGQAATWYYLEGQDEELKKRVLDMVKKYKELTDKFSIK